MHLADDAALITRADSLPPVEWPPAPPRRLWDALDERTPEGRKGLNVLLVSVKHQRLKGLHSWQQRMYWLARIDEWYEAAAEHQERVAELIKLDERRAHAALRSKRGQ